MSEPSWAQNVYEANIGIKLSKKSNLWLDAGILPSHIGFESAISSDCWTLTRSMVAENSPYYQTGLKLGYSNKSEKLNVALYVLNGWQKISKPNFTQTPSFGLQVNYTINSNLLFNYSNFVGTDKPDSMMALRTYHNVYFQYHKGKTIGIVAGFDIGTDKYHATKYGVWYSPIVVLQYTLNKKSKLALRGEYYHDQNEIIISTPSKLGFQVLGLSSNFDYAIYKNVQWRFEGKLFKAQQALFNNGQKLNFSLTTNLSIKI